MSADHTRLKGVTQAGDALLSEQLEANVSSFFTWGLLGIGAFTNVTFAPSGDAYGADQTRLRPATHPAYLDGQVWEGHRRDWVWESGVDYATQPLRVSGVYVNGTFHPSTGVGPYAHRVDYPNGMVVFDSPIAPTGTVNCEFSHRHYHFTTADAPFWRELQQGSYRADDPSFLLEGSGAWGVLAQNRVQLPAVVVEANANVTRQGLQLGGGSIATQELKLHVLSETPWDRRFLHDVITGQWQKRIIAFDLNRLRSEGKFPLDGDGGLVDGALTYPDLVKPTGEGGCGWVQVRFADFIPDPFLNQRTQEHVRGPLQYTMVRGLFEVDLP